MLPQTVGLDVVLDKETNEIVLLEVNGERSGYKGLARVGDDPTEDIQAILGESLMHSRVAFEPRILGLIEPHLEDAIDFVHDYSISYVGVPILDEEISEEDLATLLGPLDLIDAFVGVGAFFASEKYRARMMNDPVLERATRDKFMQYQLFRNVEGIHMPESKLLHPYLQEEAFEAFHNRHPWVVYKPRDGHLGNGVRILDKSAGLGNRALARGMMVDLDADEMGYSVTPEEYREHIKTRSMSFSDEKDRVIERDATHRAVVIQPFIPSAPVADEEGVGRVARARLYWHGKYHGGYWALSDLPAARHEHQVVNFTHTQRAIKFSEEEEVRFAEYANKVIPGIIRAATSTPLQVYAQRKRELDEAMFK